MIVSVVNVVLRQVGSRQGRNLTSNALIEAQWQMYTLIFVFGLAHILHDSINVRVDFWFGNRSSTRVLNQPLRTIPETSPALDFHHAVCATLRELPGMLPDPLAQNT